MRGVHQPASATHLGRGHGRVHRHVQGAGFAPTASRVTASIDTE
jgi:hypothetical protein